jgi:exosortase
VSQSTSLPGITASDSPSRPVVLAIFGTFVLTGWVYQPIITQMVQTWRAYPDYSHGFLIVPLSIYFALEKRYQLQAARLEGSWWGAALLAIGVFVLLVGELGGLLTALRSGLVFTLMGLVLLLAGKEVFKILLFPMAFLFLMVPLPQSLVNVIAFPLQLIAATWAVSGLQTMGIPALLEGNIIHLAHSELFVAEACSGLRSLMALLTLGVVFAHFFRRGRIYQQLFIVASTIPIAILVNSVRVALTGILAHNFGSEMALGFIHDFQGMITFSMAFLLLLAEARLLERIFSRSKPKASPPPPTGVTAPS